VSDILEDEPTETERGKRKENGKMFIPANCFHTPSFGALQMVMYWASIGK
jgi:hypothetical protein